MLILAILRALGCTVTVRPSLSSQEVSLKPLNPIRRNCWLHLSCSTLMFTEMWWWNSDGFLFLFLLPIHHNSLCLEPKENVILLTVWGLGLSLLWESTFPSVPLMPFRQITVGISHACYKLISARRISQQILDLFPVSYDCKVRQVSAQSNHFRTEVTEVFILPNEGMAWMN